MEMRPDIKAAVSKVLDDAPEIPHFWDMCESERLIVMIAMGFELGRCAAHEQETEATRN